MTRVITILGQIVRRRYAPTRKAPTKRPTNHYGVSQPFIYRSRLYAQKNLATSTKEGIIGNNQLLAEQSAAANLVGASSKDILPYILLVGFLGILLMGSAAVFSDSFNPKPISLESK
jgi:hypothetical protein